MNHPSAASKPCKIPGHGVPMGIPMDQKFGMTSSTATMASNMATSTCCPGRAVALVEAGLGADDGEQGGHDVAKAAHG